MNKRLIIIVIVGAIALLFFLYYNAIHYTVIKLLTIASLISLWNMENLTSFPPDINTHWSAIAPILTIRNEEEYDRAIARLNYLIDEIGSNEAHPLYNLLDTLGTLIEAYETEHSSIPDCSGSDVLAYLIEEHGLKMSDLPEIGTAETIKAILNKEQALTLSQIQQLAQRFKVKTQVFLD